MLLVSFNLVVSVNCNAGHISFIQYLLLQTVEIGLTTNLVTLRNQEP